MLSYGVYGVEAGGSGRWLAIARPSSMNVRCVSAKLRQRLPSFSRNVRQNRPSIARLGVHQCGRYSYVRSARGSPSAAFPRLRSRYCREAWEAATATPRREALLGCGPPLRPGDWAGRRAWWEPIKMPAAETASAKEYPPLAAKKLIRIGLAPTEIRSIP